MIDEDAGFTQAFEQVIGQLRNRGRSLRQMVGTNAHRGKSGTIHVRAHRARKVVCVGQCTTLRTGSWFLQNSCLLARHKNVR